MRYYKVTRTYAVAVPETTDIEQLEVVLDALEEAEVLTPWQIASDRYKLGDAITVNRTTLEAYIYGADPHEVQQWLADALTDFADTGDLELWPGLLRSNEAMNKSPFAGAYEANRVQTETPDGLSWSWF